MIQEDLIALLKKDTLDLKELKISIQVLLRFSSFDDADQFVQTCSQEYPHAAAALLSNYDETKNEFLSVSAFFSRYSEIADLIDLYGSYRGMKEVDLRVVTQMDMEYGKKRAEFADKLFQQINALDQDMKPEAAAFKALPFSSTGTQRVASFVEKISDFNYQDQKPKLEAEDHLKLRKQWHMTPMERRYRWGKALAQEVYSRSTLFEVAVGNKVYFKEEYPRRWTYPLLYTDTKGIVRELSAPWIIMSNHYWHHGKAAISDTWSDVEDLFEEIWNMNLKKSEDPNDLEAKVEYEKNLSAFYLAVCKLVWLIGNTQPLQRGTGSVAEFVFALCHQRHGLQTPTLKLQFPQLDVLDLTFPLRDYQYFFPYFFEPSTIPVHLRPHSNEITGAPAAEQVKKLYEKLNSQEERLVLARESNKKIEDVKQIQKMGDAIEVFFSTEQKTISNGINFYSLEERKRVEFECIMFIKEKVNKVKNDIIFEIGNRIEFPNWQEKYKDGLMAVIANSDLDERVVERFQEVFCRHFPAKKELPQEVFQQVSLSSRMSNFFKSISVATQKPDALDLDKQHNPSRMNASTLS